MKLTGLIMDILRKTLNMKIWGNVHVQIQNIWTFSYQIKVYSLKNHLKILGRYDC